MPIQIGTNDNVVITDAKLDEKNTLLITFEEFDKIKADAGPVSYFDNIAADGEVIEGTNGVTIRIFPSTPPKADNGKSEEDNVKMLVADINKTKGICLHILKGYYTSDELENKIVPFQSVDIDRDNFNTQVQKKEILEAIHVNMAKGFISMIQPKLEEKAKFRLLLVRQSKDKHFATFRNRFLEENPIWESMDVPQNMSKLWTLADKNDPSKGFVPAFNAYEIQNGLNHGTPVAKPAAGTTAPADTAPQTAENIFGK